MIYEPHPNQPLVDYKVSVGHFTVSVECRTRQEAIIAARRQLCHETAAHVGRDSVVGRRALYRY